MTYAWQFRGTFVCATAGLLAVACTDATAPRDLPILTVDRSLLAGEALAALGPDGRFVAPAPPDPTPYPIMTAQQALFAVDSFFRYFGPTLAPSWEGDRGGTPARWTSLRVCSEPSYAESGFEVAPSIVAEVFRAYWGPRWFIALCDGSEEVVNITIAALATEKVSEPLGIPGENLSLTYQDRGLLPGVRMNRTPEEVATRAANATGARVVRVPRRLLGDPPTTPYVTQWEVEFDRPITVVGNRSGRVTTSNRFFWGSLVEEKYRVSLAARVDPPPLDSTIVQFGYDTLARAIPVTLRRKPRSGFAELESVRVVSVSP